MMSEKMKLKEARPDRIKSIYYSHQENDPVNRGSTFRNAWKKIKILAPFLWPRKDIFLQFRVMFCFVLLAAGRVINLYVPIFSKMIGMFVIILIVSFVLIKCQCNNICAEGIALTWFSYTILRSFEVYSFKKVLYCMQKRAYRIIYSDHNLRN